MKKEQQWLDYATSANTWTEPHAAIILSMIASLLSLGSIVLTLMSTVAIFFADIVLKGSLIVIVMATFFLLAAMKLGRSFYRWTLFQYVFAWVILVLVFTRG